MDEEYVPYISPNSLDEEEMTESLIEHIKSTQRPEDYDANCD